MTLNLEPKPDPPEWMKKLSYVLRTDFERMQFAHKMLKEFKGQDPPYDALEVEFIAYCLRRYEESCFESDSMVSNWDKSQ